MRITHQMLNNTPEESNEPPEEVLSAETSKLAKYFYGNKGYRETPLSKVMLPIIARSIVSKNDLEAYSEPKCGAAMIGQKGTGKTLLMMLTALRLDVEYFDAPSLAVEFSVNGATGFWGKVEGRSVNYDFILDDLGAEAQTKNFGNTAPLKELIYARYNLWQSWGARTWFASNLSREDLLDRYGDRALDRIKEMCISIPVVGESLRK